MPFWFYIFEYFFNFPFFIYQKSSSFYAEIFAAIHILFCPNSIEFAYFMAFIRQ